MPDQLSEDPLGGDATLAAEPPSSARESLAEDATLAAEPGVPPTPGAELPAPLSLERGASVGRYLILDQLGRGGMGVVYAAFDPELDRKIALKLLHAERRSASGSTGQPRIYREAQALAKLSHPNVIAVHDVGTVAGAVFVAMEFIDGQTLGDWLEQQPRSWREVVGVMIDAGRGVAAAHRAGIVHRDFKPDNVMIGREGRVRVLDFGLARAASDEAGEIVEPSDLVRLRDAGLVETASTLSEKLTVTGSVMGTPAYMAPEQHAAKVVDERSDQFAFCVSAYEALYGERPFAGDTHATLAFQVFQGKIREPSKAASVPGWVRRVIVRGLAVNPRERWPSMDALLEALERDPTRRRRRIGAAALGLGLVAGLGAFGQRLLTEPKMCRDAESHLAGVWDRERRAKVEAAFEASGLGYADDAFAGVATELDDYAGRWTKMHTEACEATRIRGEQSDEMLTLRMACLDRQLARFGALVEVYAEADATIVEDAVEAARALPALEACADLEALRTGLRPPESAAQREQVIELRRRLDAAESLLDAGKRPLAREQLAALAEAVRASEYRPLIAEFELAYAEAIDDPEAKISGLERALWLAEASRHDRVAAEAWIELVRSYALSANDFKKAHAAAERASAVIERLGGDRELAIRLDVAHGAAYQLERKDLDRAVELLRSARRARVEAGEAGAPRALQELVSLANTLMDHGSVDEAGELLREGLPLAEARLGPDHPWTARLHATLARVQYQSGGLEDAKRSLETALTVFEGAYGERSMQVGGILNGLGLVLHEKLELEAALRSYERSLSITREAQGPRHSNVAKVLANLADIESELGRHDRAIEHYEAALAIEREIYGDDNTNVALELDDLAQGYGRKGEHERARELYGEAAAIFEAIDPEHTNLVYSRTGVGLAELELELDEQALATLERAYEQLERQRDEIGDEAAARTEYALARALAANQREPSRARELASAAADFYAKGTPRQTAIAAEIEAWLASLE